MSRYTREQLHLWAAELDGAATSHRWLPRILQRDIAKYLREQAPKQDTLEVLLDLVVETIGIDDMVVSSGGGSANPTIPHWYLYAYWQEPFRDDPGWEIEVKGDTLREVLCACIAHPRFGQ